jgi:UDP-GlcNAc:undecaprenyl-phosphate GlcNAc-1-phosphate transferase
MQTINNLYLYFLIPLFFTLFITPIIIRLARRYNCIDIPGKRRFHKYPTPRWGGVAFFIGVIPIFFFLEIDKQIASYLVASFILIILGGIDDWKPIGWRIKFLGIILATTVVAFVGDTVVHHIGTYGSYGKVGLGILSIPFTYFSVVGVTNAINLIDGLNGLAGGMSLIAFLFISIAAYLSGNYVLAIMSIAFVGALGGFLRYNFPRAKIFMGDSGSLFLGFSLAVFSIFLTQNENFRVEPMFPVMILLIPIFDTLRVMLVRAFNLKNPFRADKTHIHHLLVRRKFSSVNAVIFLWSISIILGLLAVLIIKKASTPYLVITLMTSLILSLYIDSIAKRR